MQQEKKQSEKQEVERKVKPDVKMQEGPLHAGQAPELEVQGTVGNHGALRRIGEGVIQAKLKVSQPGDKYEQEADRVAEEVGRLKEGEVPERPLVEEISHIEANELKNSNEEMGMNGIEQQLQGKVGVGQPLPATTLDEMNKMFGVDFSEVRVHTDHESSALNESIASRSFVYGRDIFFNTGKYQPETIEGKRLLSHELGHVIQQGRQNSIEFQTIQKKDESEEKTLSQKLNLQSITIRIEKDIKDLLEKTKNEAFPESFGIWRKKTGEYRFINRLKPLEKIDDDLWVIIKGSDSRAEGDNFEIDIYQDYYSNHWPGIITLGVTLSRQWKSFGESTYSAPGEELNAEFAYGKGESQEISQSVGIGITIIKDWLGLEYSESISKGVSTEKSPNIIVKWPGVKGHRLKAKFFYQELSAMKWGYDMSGLLHPFQGTWISSEKKAIIGFGKAVLKEKEARK